jgi:hypothetical protein
MAKGPMRSTKEPRKPKAQAPKKKQCVQPIKESSREGIRCKLKAVFVRTSWRLSRAPVAGGAVRVHRDTVEHWRRLVDYGRRVHRQPCGEAVGDLVDELELELAQTRVA